MVKTTKCPISRSKTYFTKRERVGSATNAVTAKADESIKQRTEVVNVFGNTVPTTKFRVIFLLFKYPSKLFLTALASLSFQLV